MAKTIPLLRRDHVNFKMVLNVIDHQIRSVDAGGVASPSLLKMVVRYFAGYPRKVHHPREDMIYGKLIAHNPPGPSFAYAVLEDHRRLSELLDTFSHAVDDLGDNELSRVVFCEAARAFVDAELEHMSLEEGHLYPNSLHRITPEEWEAIDKVMADDADPLFGEKVAAPYEELRERILDLDRASPAPDRAAD